MFSGNRREREILEKHLEYEKNLCLLFSKKEIDYSKLMELVGKIQDLRLETIKIFKIRTKEKKLEIEEGERILIRERELDERLLMAFQELKGKVENLLNSLEEDKTPVFSLNSLIDFLNLFGELSKEKEVLRKTEKEGKIIILASRDEKIPLSLKNGRKIVLTPCDYDFSSFTYDELTEILRVMDILISDETFDPLRDEIVKQISLSTSISLLK